MDYYINPQSLTSAFIVPAALVDRYFKLAKAEHIKVVLYMLKNMANELEISTIADACGISEYDTKEALLYWADAGILLPKEPISPKEEKKGRTIVAKNEKPSRTDIAKRGLEDPKIQYLLNEAQMKLARNLKDNEARTLVWLYDDQGLDVSIILLIIQYAAAKGKLNIRFVEKIATSFVENGVENIADADAQLHKMDIGEKAWSVVSSAFGIERRKPSEKEANNAVKWVSEWKIPKEMLVAAYNECVDRKSKFSFSYISKIIESWHDKGYKTLEEVKADLKKNGSDSKETYSVDLFEKMLNSKD